MIILQKIQYMLQINIYNLNIVFCFAGMGFFCALRQKGAVLWQGIEITLSIK